MNSLYSRVEQGSPTPPAESLASWYTPRHTDAFGDRLLMSDNTGGPSLELLRFGPRFSALPGFERALRARVERQQFFRHPMFPLVRAVDRLDGGNALALVSTCVPGRRLSDILRTSRGNGLHPAVCAWLVRQLVPALAELQRRGGGPHGLVTADRIVITSEGSLALVDHVLGAALEHLYLPPAKLWADFGLLVPGAIGFGRFDNQTDIVQLALVVLSASLGRQIRPEEFPESVDSLLDEFAETVERRAPRIARDLRAWLERALRPFGNLFKSAEHAKEGLSALPEAFAEALEMEGEAEVVRRVERPMFGVVAEAVSPELPVETDAMLVEAGANMRPWTTNRSLMVAAVLGVVVIAQAVALVHFVRSPAPPAGAAAGAAAVVIDSPQAGDAVIVDGRQAGVTPLSLKVGTSIRSIRVVRQESPADGPAVAAVPTGAHPTTEPAARLRSGGLRLVSPIQLTVFEGGRLVAAGADGTVTLSAGQHQLELVNSALRYQLRQTVTVKADEVVSLQVTPSNGQLSIDASPSAQVSIDDRVVGDTPLSNVPVPLGEHDVTFRHPQLGERHLKVLIRSGDSSRVSVAFPQ